MDLKIKVTFSDGKRRVMKAPEKLKDINPRYAARFLMDTLEVYKGYCDGEIGESGEFILTTTAKSGGVGIALPYSRLLGWCYVTGGRKKETRKTTPGIELTCK